MNPAKAVDDLHNQLKKMDSNYSPSIYLKEHTKKVSILVSFMEIVMLSLILTDFPSRNTTMYHAAVYSAWYEGCRLAMDTLQYKLESEQI